MTRAKVGRADGALHRAVMQARLVTGAQAGIEIGKEVMAGVGAEAEAVTETGSTTKAVTIGTGKGALLFCVLYGPKL